MKSTTQRCVDKIKKLTKILLWAYQRKLGRVHSTHRSLVSYSCLMSHVLLYNLFNFRKYYW